MLYFDGHKLRAARREMGYKQEQLAGLVGASVRVYQNWEEGKATPNATYFLRLIAALSKTDALAFASNPANEEDAADE